MKKLLLFALPLLFSFTLSAQITQEEADSIVIDRLANQPNGFTIYAKENMQTNFVVLTATNEKLKLSYPCWVYYVNFTDETNSKYLIVKESNGNVLEVNAWNDEGPEELEEWRMVPYIPHSVWICTKAVPWSGIPSYPLLDLSFSPSLGKLIVRTNITDEYGTQWSGTYDYYLEVDSYSGYTFLHLTPDLFDDMPWCIRYKSETEMRIYHGGMNGTMYYFICLTNFNDI